MLASSITRSSTPSRSAAAEPRFAQFLLCAPALLLALIAVPYRYEFTLAEPDLVRMMAAMVYGQSTGLPQAAGMHYGIEFSFGYYKLLDALAPQAWLRDPDLTAALINRAGVVSGVLCAWTCTLYLNKLFGLTVALATAAMFFLSPMMLPAALSGHPLMSAAACLFAGGWILAKGEESDGIGRRCAYYGAAFLLMVSALSLRAEVALAFPFVWLATTRAVMNRGPMRRAYVWKGLVLAAAFVAFLVLQRSYISASGGAASRLGSFVQTFMSASLIGRGLVVLALAAGIATLVAASIAALRGRWRDKELYLPMLLAAPALVLWLPNPQPARHFFFVVLAMCLLTAFWLDGRQKNRARAVLLCLAVVLGNQLIAELLSPAIVSRYAWSYPSAAARRATQQVPLGAFPLDQRANQTQVNVEREEAIRLAAQAPQRLVILADSQHYLIAHLIAADARLKWSESRLDGIAVDELRSPDRTIALVEKHDAWPRDVTSEILAYEPWKGWPVYVQPSTVSRFDKAVVPAERRFQLR